jgi:hypothetical protein
MKRQRLFLVVGLVVSTALAGCSARERATAVKGSGVVKSETRPVAGFSAIALTAVGKVIVQQTGTESLTISAEDNLLPLLETRVADGTLHLDVKDGANIDPTKPIEYTVTVKALAGLNVSGTGSVEASAISGQWLRVKLSGVGGVSVAGSAETLELDLSGLGHFRGADFKVKQATVRSSGVGSAVVNASDQLDATVSGVGSVEYLGSPQVQQSVSGVGSVKPKS